MDKRLFITWVIAVLLVGGCYRASKSGSDTESETTTSKVKNGNDTDTDSARVETVDTASVTESSVDTQPPGGSGWDSLNGDVDSDSAGLAVDSETGSISGDSAVETIDTADTPDTENAADTENAIDTVDTSDTLDVADTFSEVMDSSSDHADTSSATDDCYPGNFFVSDATDLATIAQVTCIDGNLDISSTSLTAISLPGLKTVHGSLTITWNPDLTLLDFTSLERVGAAFNISQNGVLLSLGGFESLVTVGGEVTIASNTLLEKVGDLTSLAQVGGRIVMTNNPQLQNFTWPALASVEGAFIIAGSTLLQELLFPAWITSGGILANRPDRVRDSRRRRRRCSRSPAGSRCAPPGTGR